MVSLNGRIGQYTKHTEPKKILGSSFNGWIVPYLTYNKFPSIVWFDSLSLEASH